MEPFLEIVMYHYREIPHIRPGPNLDDQNQREKGASPMSEKALKELLEKVSGDKGFAERLRNDPIGVLCEMEMSTVEVFALTCADEDALRRLLNASGYDRSIDYSIFRDAALPAFNEEAKQEMLDRCGGKTTSVTSSTVTKCCW